MSNKYHWNRVVKCPSGKRVFHTKDAALYEIAMIQAKNDPLRPKTEKRTYRCEYCRGWHLTARKLERY